MSSRASGATRDLGRDMIDDMGIFRTTIALENPVVRGALRELANVMVDTGSEYTWVPRVLLEELGVASERTMRFSLADGSIIERPIGFAIVHAAGTSAPARCARPS